MRSSDWSSDVCSADLETLRALDALGFLFDSSFNGAYAGHGCDIALDHRNIGMRLHHGVCEVPVSGLMDRADSFRPAQLCAMSEEEMRDALDHAAASGAIQFSAFSHSFELLSRVRSEEPTSELQSLMRISYAVFCLKKKKPRTS